MKLLFFFSIITRYLSDEFTSIYKSDSQPNLNQSYDETMVIEETVETVDIDSELQMVDVSTEQVSLEEIPLEQETEVASQDVETEQPTQEDAEVAYLNSPQTPTQDEPLVELEGKFSTHFTPFTMIIVICPFICLYTSKDYIGNNNYMGPDQTTSLN